MNRAYVPPNLRPAPLPDDFAPQGTLTATVPVTLYWGMERNVEMDGFRPAGIPHWLGRFDWVVGFEFGWAGTEQFPESVFCEPAYLPALLAFLRHRWRRAPGSPRLLVVGAGPDFLISWHTRRVIRGLRRYFTCIYYEARDIEIEGVQVMPIGLTEHYVRSNSPEILALAQELNRAPAADSQTPSVLAAWGAWWPGLDELIEDRRAAREFAATSDLVTPGQFTSVEWFESLSRFDFMICPLGNGVQAPKMVEALLMGCIPITTRHPAFEELEARGMPILIVDRWGDISENLLQASYEDLFPRAMEFRKRLLDLDQWWEFSFPCHPHRQGALLDGQIPGATPHSDQ